MEEFGLVSVWCPIIRPFDGLDILLIDSAHFLSHSPGCLNVFMIDIRLDRFHSTCVRLAT